MFRIIRRGTGSVVTWRRAQMLLLSTQGMPVTKIAEVTFTSDDRVRDVIHNFNIDGFDSLYPKYKGGRPKTFTLPGRREIKKIAKSRPAEHGLPFSTWSLTRLADFLVAQGVVDDISHEGLRILLREEDVSFQRLKTWKTSRDPDYAAKKARVEHLYAIADGELISEEGEPEVILCMDEFGPLNLMPHPRRQQTTRGRRGRKNDPLYRARRTLHTGADLLTDRQAARLTALLAIDEHVEVEATWGIYQRMIAAYRHPDPAGGRELMVKLIESLSAGVPRPLVEIAKLGRTLNKQAADVLAYFDRPGTSNGPTEAINGCLEHLRGSALGFRNLTNYIARSLLETGGFRPRLHPAL
ncbi:transposase [Streptomyces acidicola]